MSTKHYFINPDREKPWNDLPKLPIEEENYKTIAVYEQLGKAKEALGRLHGRSAVIPNLGLLINSITLQEAKLSTEIENIFTTDDELYKAYSDNPTEISSGAKEVLRYRQALWTGFQHLAENKVFSQNYFDLIIQVINQSNEGLRQPFNNTVIRQGGTGPNAGKTIYTPPKGTQVLTELMQNLIAFLNDDEKYPLDPLLKMAIAHYQFEAIHPFRDGNGRTGRLFNIHFLTNKNLLDVPILFLSRYILEHKDEYYTGLSAVSQRGDWENWLLFVLRAVEITSIDTFIKINDIMTAKESITTHLQENGKYKDLEKLMTCIFTNPFTKVKHLTDPGLYSENTARNYLNELCKEGVMEKKEMEGKHYYLNVELYKILKQ